ncbi:MAG: ribosome biogenesis GTPase Der [Candidatus Marinimicrobia bacterium]|nr:ribosome biogenesis GTPase Der [Candidatus Neomarinimicrobiota bacterium]
MPVSEPIVAIVGRPNVGKSTLFNRIAQKRKSIIHSEPGITRDRIYESVNWAGYQFILIDTGGFIFNSNDQIEKAIRAQVAIAVDEADLVLFLVDSMDSITSMDREIGSLLRESSKTVLLVVNKCDNEKREQNLYGFYELGFDDPLPIAALNGRRIGDLLDCILEKLPREAPLEQEKKDQLHLAIVGMPNVGKSSIVNALLGTEKVIVTEIPGTTRDSIDSELKYYSEPITLIDTAGLRKKSSIKDNIEFYSMVRANLSINRCHVAIVVVDALKGFARQDANIIRTVISKKKGLVLVINKWDLIEKNSSTLIEFQRDLIDAFRQLEHYPIIFISALTKQRIHKVIETAKEVYLARKQRISTNKLNNFFQDVINKIPPPAVQGKYIKIKYLTQVKREPPVFVFFCNYPKDIKEEYRRFLENQLRAGFGFRGVPLTIIFRQK